LFNQAIDLKIQASTVTNTPVDVTPTKLKYEGGMVINTGGAVCYLQVFFKPAAQVTLGSTNPDDIIECAASGQTRFILEAHHHVTPLGISIAVTGGPRDASAPGAAAIVGIYLDPS